MTYKVNRAAIPSMNMVGQEKTPVFILDNFLENLTASLLHEKERLGFSPAPTYYPGIRAKLPEAYILAVAQAVVPLLCKIYAVPTNSKIQFFDSYYSLVTCEPEQLSIEQQIPHFDGTEQNRFALLHYLNPAPHGGTAFYRHTSTNIERVNEQNVDKFLNSVGQNTRPNDDTNPGYINDSNSNFTKIGAVPYAQNRMVIYPGNLLHSGVINNATDIDESPITGRLTANIFLSFQTV